MNFVQLEYRVKVSVVKFVHILKSELQKLKRSMQLASCAGFYGRCLRAAVLVRVSNSSCNQKSHPCVVCVNFVSFSVCPHLLMLSLAGMDAFKGFFVFTEIKCARMSDAFGCICISLWNLTRRVKIWLCIDFTAFQCNSNVSFEWAGEPVFCNKWHESSAR